MITNDKNAQKISGKYVRPVKLPGLSTDVKPTWLEWGAESAATPDAEE